MADESLISWSPNNKSLPEAFEASVSYASAQREALDREISESASTLSDNLSILGEDALNAFSGEDIEALGSAAGNAALSYLQQKIQRIKDGLTNKRPITVRALIGEVSPYVTDTSEAFSKLVTKSDNLVRYLLGLDSSGTLADALDKDIINSLSNDPGIQSAVAGLSAIKVYADTLNTVSDAIQGAQRIMKIVEPYIPIIEVTAALFNAVRTQNAASTLEAQEKAALEVSKNAQKLVTLLLGSFRRYVYNLEIMMPELFLGAMNSISVRDAVTGLSGADDWLRAIFDEQFYDETLYSTNWTNSINNALSKTLGSVEDASRFNIPGLEGTKMGEFMKSKFMSTLTENFMIGAVATARKNAHIRSYSKHEWVKAPAESKKISLYYLNEKGEFDYDKYLENSSTLSPFNSTASIRTISKQILDRDE